MNELHLIVDWDFYFSEETIIQYIDQYELELCETFHIPGLKNRIETMSEFYKYPVDDFRGENNFIAYLVKCPKVYGTRKTSKGKRRVNTIMLDIKQSLRKFEDAAVHTTDNVHETKHAMNVLGLYERYVAHYLKMID
tara:strand:+ start:12380 stop:12790 length:411 start_codon:yes stop_codon:yes gene_type:complete